MTAKHRPGSVLETEKLSGLSRVSLHIGSVELADTGEQPIRSLHADQSEAFIRELHLREWHPHRHRAASGHGQGGGHRARGAEDCQHVTHHHVILQRHHVSVCCVQCYPCLEIKCVTNVRWALVLHASFYVWDMMGYCRTTLNADRGQ